MVTKCLLKYFYTRLLVLLSSHLCNEDVPEVGLVPHLHLGPHHELVQLVLGAALRSWQRCNSFSSVLGELGLCHDSSYFFSISS